MADGKVKDIHDKFTPVNDREIQLAWRVIEGLGDPVSLGTARRMISDSLRIARLNQPLGESR